MEKNILIKKAMIKLSDLNTILFVCKGNICRSPFAQYYAKKKLPKSIDILSSGYYSETGRKCPMKAIKAAKEFDINLENHLSTQVTKELIQDVQIIYVFDEENKHVLDILFPYAKNKIFLLGALFEIFPKIISDPYGKRYSQYRKTYQLISNSIDRLNKIMEI